MNKDNFTMLCDFYELTMANGYFKNGFYKRTTYFDVFFRNVPDNGGFAIAAGLDQIIEYIKELHFSAEDIEFLRSKKIFDEEFLEYLKDFRFTGDIYAVPEGTPVFPHEPVLTVKAPAIEAQLIETYILLAINHQSLIATKANRIVRAANGRTVLEFGSRRAQGADGAVIGARAAYIGGCAGTACTLTDFKYGVPAGGTMAHSWVQMFDTEYDAFKTYCEIYPDNAVLLVDTYNTLKSGVPNAIKAFKEVLVPKGITNFGIRLDSGDISYLSKKARKMLDENDVFNMINGSNGVLGALDNAYFIYKRKRTVKEEPSTLTQTGRDVFTFERLIQKSDTEGKWTKVGSPEEEAERRKREKVDNSPVTKTILALLKAQPSGWTGTTRDFIKASLEILGGLYVGTEQEVGREIKDIEIELLRRYNIDHTMKHSNNGNKHSFFPKQKYNLFNYNK